MAKAKTAKTKKSTPSDASASSDSSAPSGASASSDSSTPSDSAVPGSSFDPPQEPDWHRRIAEAAYLRAERRGFAGDQRLEDWLAAETEVKESLQSEASRP
jgi:Protein of unknown function (DUF2934)